VRASFHFYNDEGDIETLIGALKDLRGRYAG
jgi:selenocysteine lyase/cysteine desulfurase